MITLDPVRGPTTIAVPYSEAGNAIRRLLEVAQSDTGQSALVADFLLAWWNGNDLGHFPVLHLCNVDGCLSRDMLTIMAYLSQKGVWYPNNWGFEEALRELTIQWRIVDAGER